MNDGTCQGKIMRQAKAFIIAIFAALLTFAAVFAFFVINAEPTVTPQAVRIESGTVEISIQVRALRKIIEAVRVDNLGGVSSLWRSDGQERAEPLVVRHGNTELASGSAIMSFKAGISGTSLSLRFEDNGAFSGKNTDFRITVFFSDGGRALCELSAEQISQFHDFSPNVQVSGPVPQDSAPAFMLRPIFEGWLSMILTIGIIIITIFVMIVIFSKKRLLDKALTGDARAQFTAFKMYKDKNGKADLAMEFLSKSAEQGHTDAQIELGTRCQSGDGIAENPAKAAELFEKAAAQGSTTAQYNLALCYQTGNGVEKDLARAADLFEKTAAHGHIESKVKLKETKAESGDSVSMYELAELFFNGSAEVKKDEASAMLWLNKAATVGDARAQEDLGMRYLQGNGVQKDISKATQWLGKQGSAGALYILAMCYKSGDGIEKNLPMAIDLFEKSLAMGHVESELRLKECKAESGDIDSMYELGIMNFHSNETRALEWLDKAAKHGHLAAGEKLNTFRAEQIDRVVSGFYAFENSGRELTEKMRTLLDWTKSDGSYADKIWDKSMRLYGKSPLDAVCDHDLISPPSDYDMNILKASNDPRRISILKDIEKLKGVHRDLKTAQFNSRRQ